MISSSKLPLFEKIAPQFYQWKQKNKYYHTQLRKLYQFLIPPNQNILEIGSAHGDLLHALRPQYGVGIDFSANMLAHARRRYPHLHFYPMDAEHLQAQPFTKPFDYIIMQDLIGDLDDVWKTFRSLRTVSTEHTHIIITYYNHLWQPLLALAEKLHLKMRLGRQNWLALDDIENLLHLNGFDVVKKGRSLLMPKYLPLLSNFLNKYIAHLPLIRTLCLTEYVVARKLPDNPTLPEYSTSIVIPTRNEAGNIEKIVQRIPAFGTAQEIIFVNKKHKDNSEAAIRDVIKKYPDKNIHFIDQGTGAGKGNAVRKGFDKATGDILMILDADMTVPPEDLPKFYLALQERHGEFINGTRLVYPMEKEAMRTLNLFGNKMFSLIFTWLLDQRIKDTLCGTKVLLKQDYEKIKKGRAYFGNFDPFGDFDLLFGAAKNNLKIVEVPIRYQERTYGTTNIQRFKHGLILFRMCWFALRKIKFI